MSEKEIIAKHALSGFLERIQSQYTEVLPEYGRPETVEHYVVTPIGEDVFDFAYSTDKRKSSLVRDESLGGEFEPEPEKKGLVLGVDISLQAIEDFRFDYHFFKEQLVYEPDTFDVEKRVLGFRYFDRGMWVKEIRESIEENEREARDCTDDEERERFSRNAIKLREKCLPGHLKFYEGKKEILEKIEREREENTKRVIGVLKDFF
jgi:hypothetical protein